MHRRLRFAAPLVLTFACGHARAPDPPAPPLDHPDQAWSLHRDADGRCEAEAHDDCDEDRDGHTCNPPEPTAYRCPSSLDGYDHATIDKLGAQCWLTTCRRGRACEQPAHLVTCPDDEPQPHETPAPERPDWL